MRRDSLTFGVAEEAAIDQYLRDKAEDEISTGDLRFCSWLTDAVEKNDPRIRDIIRGAVNYDPTAINTNVERLRNDYIESRIEDRDERAEAYRGLFEETSDVE